MSSNYDDRRAFLNPSSLSDPEVARLSKRVFVSSLLVYGFSTAFWLWASANSYTQERWDWGTSSFVPYMIAGVHGLYAARHADVPLYSSVHIVMLFVGMTSLLTTYIRALIRAQDAGITHKVNQHAVAIALWTAGSIPVFYYAIKFRMSIRR